MFKQRFGYMALFMTLALAGCGSSSIGGGDPVPLNSTVKINPSSITWTIPAPLATPCVVDFNNHNDTPIAISVLDSSQSPLGNIGIRVLADLSGNTYSGSPVLKVYDDLNGNGVVDDPAELVSSNTSPAFNTFTDKYTGTKNILLRVNLSCPYSGNLYVFAGAAFASINIVVKTP